VERGSELGWSMLAGPKPSALAVEVYKYMVFNDPDWDFRAFDASKDIAKAEQTILWCPEWAIAAEETVPIRSMP
jgi:hypothetical protein